MKRKIVKNDTQRLTHLRILAGLSSSPEDGALPILSEPLLEEATVLAVSFETAATNLTELRHGLRDLQGKRREAMQRLTPLVRGFLSGLRSRVSMGRTPASALTLYGLPVHGAKPRPTSRLGWLECAAALVAGDQAAEMAGLPIMVEPGRDELQAILDEVPPLQSAIDKTDLELASAQENMIALRERVGVLLDRVGRYLSYSLSIMDASRQRRIMRIFGFFFVNEGRDGAESETDLPIAV